MAIEQGVRRCPSGLRCPVPVARRPRRVVILSFVYLALKCTIELELLCFRSSDAKRGRDPRTAPRTGDPSAPAAPSPA